MNNNSHFDKGAGHGRKGPKNRSKIHRYARRITMEMSREPDRAFPAPQAYYANPGRGVSGESSN